MVKKFYILLLIQKSNFKTNENSVTFYYVFNGYLFKI